METVSRWTIIEELPKVKGKPRMALCRCECGTERPVLLLAVRTGASKSCGCIKVEMTARRQAGLVGQRFGRLVIKEIVTHDFGWANGRKVPAARCECDCGEQRIVALISLTNGLTRSCGCLTRDVGRENIDRANRAQRSLTADAARGLLEIWHGGGATVRMDGRFREKHSVRDLEPGDVLMVTTRNGARQIGDASIVALLVNRGWLTLGRRHNGKCEATPVVQAVVARPPLGCPRCKAEFVTAELVRVPLIGNGGDVARLWKCRKCGGTWMRTAPKGMLVQEVADGHQEPSV